MKKVALSDSEWKIMKLLWQESPLSCRQMEDKLKSDTGWTRHSLFTLLKRMIGREAIRVEETSPVNLYYPLLDKGATERKETKAFVDKLFSGDIGLLVAQMVDQRQLDEGEIDRLVAMLNKAKEERGK